ncbi:MAG: FecR family protein [Carboxylicivirga sp.]|jgi:ferric-dicitrate binding protein FerR (iron transport regulator)|nr:FecR family protein [Carboxylicivirga sp.]
MKVDLDDIIQRLISEKITEEELDGFQDSFLDNDNEQVVKRALKAHLNGIRDDRTEPLELDHLYSKIRNQIKQQEVSKKRDVKMITFKKWMKVAAIICFGIFVGSLYNSYQKNDVVDYTSVITAGKGSVAKASLPDGTFIYINSESKVTYNPSEWTDLRKITLEGEAWFEVKSNKSNPFVVHTPFYDVLVTGTRFNIKSYKRENVAVTTLEEGSVIIKKGKGKWSEAEINLKPGQQYVYNAQNKKGEINEVMTELYSTWRHNKLVYINKSLGEMIQGFEKKYGVEIVVVDQDLLQYHYDGTFENESIIEVLELLKLTWPIEYSIRGQKIIIKRKTH